MAERNHSIDILKVFLIITVIVVHLMPYKFSFDYQTNIATIIHGIGRTVVPLFFIISGFYLKEKISDINKVTELVKKYIKMFIIWQILYFPLVIIYYKNNLFNNKDIFLNLLYGFGHLWFLNALLIGLCMLYVVRNKSSTFKLTLAFTLLIIGHFLKLALEFNIFNNFTTIIYEFIGTSRNWLFFGFPYLLIGTIINKISCTNIKLWSYIFFILVIVESFFYTKLKINMPDIFIFSIPFCIFTFKLILNMKTNIKFSINPKLLLGIYLIQFYPIFYITINYPSTLFSQILIKILATLLISSILFYILNVINKKIKILF